MKEMISKPRLLIVSCVLAAMVCVGFGGARGGGGGGGVGARPIAPSGLSAVAVSSSHINLAWTDNSSNETGFKIERKTGAGGTWAEIGVADANVTAYTSTGLTASTTCYYRVRAYNEAGNSGYSTEASDTTPPPPPGMALIPSGCFNMGDAFSEGTGDELPVHNVCITSFYMDVHEVTNAEYKACVSSGACTVPASSSSFSGVFSYGNANFKNFPVIYTSWYQAKAYCIWSGKRLPTEAEWEYAARGGLSGKRYPWGDTINGANANYWVSGDQWDNDTSPVKYYVANGYGLYDMSGNVWEWVNDWYSDIYYSISPTKNPPGPDSGTYRVMRGGSWLEDTLLLRVSYRGYYYPMYRNYYIGFRCAGD
jgi:formylglycine-generating enzyme required for sulfatase activity